jgi:broad specificity phosphatase PhoE
MLKSIAPGYLGISAISFARHGKAHGIATNASRMDRCDLTEDGVGQARGAARLLREAGIAPEVAYTSMQAIHGVDNHR